MESGSGDWRELAERLRTSNERIAELTITAESDDGFVTATVDARGRLTALDIDPRVYRNPDSGALARNILEVVQVAGERVDRQVVDKAVESDLVERHGPGGVRSLLDELERLAPGRRQD